MNGLPCLYQLATPCKASLSPAAFCIKIADSGIAFLEFIFLEVTELANLFIKVRSRVEAIF